MPVQMMLLTLLHSAVALVWCYTPGAGGTGTVMDWGATPTPALIPTPALTRTPAPTPAAVQTAKPTATATEVKLNKLRLLRFSLINLTCWM